MLSFIRQHLVADADRVLKYAWSVRLMALAALLSGAEVGIQVITAYNMKVPLPPALFAVLATLVTVAAFAARFFAQRKVSGGNDA